MHYKQIIQEEYQIAVRESKIATQELKDALKTSDRVPAFLDNLEVEIARAEAKVFQKTGRMIKLETIRWAIRSMTEQFLHNMEAMAQARITSDLEAYRLKKAQDEAMNPEKHLQSMGVITDDPAKKQDSKI